MSESAQAPHTRRQVCLSSKQAVINFVSALNRDGSTDRYVLENSDGSYTVSARSFLGVIYASSEFGDDIYLVNQSHDGVFPIALDLM
jgi:hypothetical protein